LGAELLPQQDRADRHHADGQGGLDLGEAGEGDAAQGGGDGGQVLQAVGLGLVAEQDVELARDDQHADAGQHAVHDGRRDGAEPVAQLGGAGDQLDQAGDHQDRTQHGQAVLGDDLEDDDGQAGGGTADLQGRAGQGADDDAADDAGDQAALGRDAGGDGDAHAEGHRHQEDDDRGDEVPRQDRLESPELAARGLLGEEVGARRWGERLGHSAAMPRWSAATMRRDGRWATGRGAPS
jgi:hypothetical protein